MVNRRPLPTPIPTLLETFRPTCTLTMALAPWMSDASGAPLPPLRAGVEALYACTSYTDLVRLVGSGDMGLWSQVLIAAFLQPALAEGALVAHRGNYSALAGELLRLKAEVAGAEGRGAAVEARLEEIRVAMAGLVGLGVRFNPPWTLAPGEGYTLSPDALSACKTGGSGYDANVCGGEALGVGGGVHEWRVHFAPTSSLIFGVCEAGSFLRGGGVGSGAAGGGGEISLTTPMNQHYSRGWWLQVYQQNESSPPALSLWAASGQGDGDAGFSKMGEPAGITPPAPGGERVIMVKLDTGARTLTFGTNGVYHDRPSYWGLPQVPLLPCFLPLNVGLQFTVVT